MSVVTYVTPDVLIGALLKYYRKKLGYTQSDVATNFYGVCVSVYCRHELGKITTPVSFIHRLADLVGCLVSDIYAMLAALTEKLIASDMVIIKEEDQVTSGLIPMTYNLIYGYIVELEK